MVIEQLRAQEQIKRAAEATVKVFSSKRGVEAVCTSLLVIFLSFHRRRLEIFEMDAIAGQRVSSVYRDILSEGSSNGISADAERKIHECDAFVTLKICNWGRLESSSRKQNWSSSKPLVGCAQNWRPKMRRLCQFGEERTSRS